MDFFPFPLHTFYSYFSSYNKVYKYMHILALWLWMPLSRNTDSFFGGGSNCLKLLNDCVCFKDYHCVTQW